MQSGTSLLWPEASATTLPLCSTFFLEARNLIS
jgi:hypothetical protein